MIKKLFLLISVLLVTLCIAEEETIEAPIVFQEIPSSWTPFIYVEMESIFPGVGMTYRYHEDHLGFEASGSCFFLFYFIPTFKVATHLLFYPKIRGISKFNPYIGVGFGCGFVLDFDGCGKYVPLPYIPVFIGFQKKSFFFDIGCDILGFNQRVDFVPVARIGFNF